MYLTILDYAKGTLVLQVIEEFGIEGPGGHSPTLGWGTPSLSVVGKECLLVLKRANQALHDEANTFIAPQIAQAAVDKCSEIIWG